MTNITDPFTPRTNLLIGKAVIVIGFIMLIWAVSLSYSRFVFEQSAVNTTGIVKSLNPPFISFHTQAGASVTFKQNFRLKSYPGRVGEEVDVSYLPNDPTEAQMTEFIWSGPRLIGLFAVLICVFGYLIVTGRLVVGSSRQGI